jgi:hypothetical protein
MLVRNIKRVGEADIRFCGWRNHHGDEAAGAGESHKRATFMVAIVTTAVRGWSLDPGVRARKVDNLYCGLTTGKR